MSKKINNNQRRTKYQDKYKRKFSRNWFRYCSEPLENIQGWNEMLNDTSGQQWVLHHRDEIQEDGEVISECELKNRGQYKNLPANKLIFLTESEHKSLHYRDGRSPACGKNHSGELNPNYKYNIKKEELHELYVVQGLTQQEIGDKIGCSHQLISKRLRRFGIRKQAV